MKYIDVDWDIPFYNFALEEYLLETAPEDHYVFFYVHRPSVIVGLHQNTEEEIHKPYIEENDIIVARRLSGGGAVYHDGGNLNFSFVKPGKPTDVTDFEAFTKPIVAVLRQLGADAHLSGRNDLLIGDRKISGNAACYRNGRIMSHGTLLVRTNMEALSRALHVQEIKIKSKGVPSVKSRVGNIADYAETGSDVQALKQAILRYFIETEGVEPFYLSKEALDQIARRAEEHFATWAWNWGASPKFSLQRLAKFPFGIVDVRFSIKNGYIDECRIFGDFFTWEDVKRLEAALMQQPFTQDAIRNALRPFDVSTFFPDVDNNRFVSFLWKGVEKEPDCEED